MSRPKTPTPELKRRAMYQPENAILIVTEDSVTANDYLTDCRSYYQKRSGSLLKRDLYARLQADGYPYSYPPKPSKSLFDHVFPKLETAIKHAKRVLGYSAKFSNPNPSTCIHLLVKELQAGIKPLLTP